MITVTLLDVGHGSCAIVRSGETTVVVDCPTGPLLLDTLQDMGVESVAAAVISHADRDHIAGIVALLISESVRVDSIYVNPDGQKNTKIWTEFRVAVAVAERKGSCKVVTSLSTTMPGTIPMSGADITVVSPSAALALTGVGGKTPEGHVVTANTLSGVLRVNAECGGDGVLLAGDMDEISLGNATAAGADLSADVLVFPHHGGLSRGADPSGFAAALLDAVKPKAVIFSNGRGRHDNPRPEIVGQVRKRACLIACTQLSKRCQATTVDATAYLEPIRAQGRHAGSCCAGSITFSLLPVAERIPGAIERHQSFITAYVATPMCRLS